MWYQFAEDKIWQFFRPKLLFSIQQIWNSNVPSPGLIYQTEFLLIVYTNITDLPMAEHSYVYGSGRWGNKP